MLILPALVLSGLMLGAVGMFISSTVRQLENFAGVMNFVIFPAFFLSSALYPLWHMREVERAALSHLGRRTRSRMPWSWSASRSTASSIRSRSAVVLGCLVGFLVLAIWGYKPSRGMEPRAPARRKLEQPTRQPEPS